MRYVQHDYSSIITIRHWGERHFTEACLRAAHSFPRKRVSGFSQKMQIQFIYMPQLEDMARYATFPETTSFHLLGQLFVNGACYRARLTGTKFQVIAESLLLPFGDDKNLEVLISLVSRKLHVLVINL
jgi:hypothetical protein